LTAALQGKLVVALPAALGRRHGDAMALVVVPVDRLSRDALDGLVEEFVTRDGTDYGEQEDTLEEKKDAVIHQLDRGEIVIVFDSESETANIVPKEAVGPTP
jgi:uncharacterized protein YheU (UPF0270 family)